MPIHEVTSRVSNVQSRSRSVRVTVPPLVVNLLELACGDTLVWTVDLSNGRVSAFKRTADGSPR